MENALRRLFHGTTAEHARHILKSGFRPQTCFTTDLELAAYYGECACDELEAPYDSIVILEALVSDEALSVDYRAFEEPITLYRNDYACSDREWDELLEQGEIPFPKSDDDIETALLVTWSVKTRNAISAHLVSEWGG